MTLYVPSTRPVPRGLPRALSPGSPGWSVEEILRPEVALVWAEGRYELVEGVVTVMSAGRLYGNRRLQRLIRLVEAGLAPGTGEFAHETDTVLAEDRIVRPDAVFMTPADDERQRQAMLARDVADPEDALLYVPPTLVIESLSQGHERHDRVTKRKWYAQAGVPHYWLLDGSAKSLECLRLVGNVYEVDQSGSAGEEVRPSLFPGLVIRLAELWA